MRKTSAKTKPPINHGLSSAIGWRGKFIFNFHAAAKKSGIRIIVGCRLDLLDGPSLLAYPANKGAYSQLSNLLTLGNQRAEKGECHLYKADVYKYTKGVKFVALPPAKLNEAFEFDSSFENALKEYREVFGDDLYIAASRRYQGDDSKYLFRAGAVVGEIICTHCGYK